MHKRKFERIPPNNWSVAGSPRVCDNDKEIMVQCMEW